MSSAPASSPPAAQAKKDRSHYLYMAVIVAVALGIAGRPRRPRLRRQAQADRRGVRQPDQDDDLAGHLLHHRAGGRLGRAAPPTSARSAAWRSATSSTMSTVALAIGLVVGNVIKPGDGLNLTPRRRRGRRGAGR